VAAETLRAIDVEGAAPLAGVRLLAPLRYPRKVICAGVNYRRHLAEMGTGAPPPDWTPFFFLKPPTTTVVGPFDDIPVDGPEAARLDWEAELAVVVGATLRRAGREEAVHGIAGWTVANDVSVRDWQRRTLQWPQGKAWDATTPVGPVVVTPDEIDPGDGLTISCRVNGEEVQRDSTATLVFDSADLLAYISTFTVLRPGDLVLTGTPGGIGAARDPARFLADGDVLETEIEGIGTCRNRIRLTDPVR
jgi:acylpyruvate hydrolase